MEKTLNKTVKAVDQNQENLTEVTQKNDESVKKTYSFDEALVEATKYFSGDELAANVWINKYALKDSQGNIFESNPDQMHNRLAKEIARVESKYDNPYSEEEINLASNKIISVQNVQNGYVRPTVWRGSEMMAISAQQTKIHVAIATWEWGSYFDPKLKTNGIKLNISRWRRPSPNSIPWDSKASGLYMICTLSKHEAEQQGFTDSMMLDHEGNIAEATGANIFFKDKDGNLHTPTPDSFLDGITRRTVIEIAKSKGIKVHERKIAPTELTNFVGCFLTGTAAEVTPVSCVADNQFKVCETIIDLNESYQALVRKK